jgi:hypothetical protein
MEPVTYPLPVPENEEELERNLKIIERDLGFSREQIAAHAHGLKHGEPLPDVYKREERGYVYTLLSLNVGFGDDEEIWAEKSQIAADNLAQFIESGALTTKRLTAYVQAVTQAWKQRQGFKDPYTQTELGPTMTFLKGALWTAFEVGEETGIVAKVPLICQLMEAGQATPLDLLQATYDVIVGEEETSETA